MDSHVEEIARLSASPWTGSPREPIALVGIGCRFPGGANSPAAFWKLLSGGVDAVGDLPADRWNERAFYDPRPGVPGKTPARRGGFIEAPDRFDCQFFGIAPREARRMDPQQRLLLEVAWHALEDAGQALERLAGTRTAVFVGISNWDSSLLQLSVRDRGLIDAYTNTGGSLSIAANRLSYCFDFRGPSVAVDTACSSALVAVHLACRSIWEDGCPLALAGGVNALLMPDGYIGFSRLGMLSPDGKCKAFDARANGYVRSEGAGMVLLKPLRQALADGDRIYALIRGTAVNQDGRTPGMTVPSQEAQEALLVEAYRNAGVAPGQVQYVEAHGTGTPVGDPIEARALGNILSADRVQPCVIGSVKTNIGHLEAGSGIAGLIKTALALYHREVPGNLHFNEPNPDIDFERLRLRVPVQREPWPARDGPALAGVNSFGYGGTNAHVVLQEACEAGMQGSNGATKDGRAVLVPLTARSPQALRALAGSWCTAIDTWPDTVTVQDVAWNAACRRSHHEHRLAIVAGSKDELRTQLAALAASEPGPKTGSGKPRLAFVCSGQGPQWWAMGRQLLAQEPVFRAMIERCDALARKLGPWSLLEELQRDEARSRLAETAIAQPAIFALQVALAELWASWGVKPEAVVGHSVGEVAAAYIAGIFSLDEAVRIIYERGRCMELARPRGRMLAAALSSDEAQRLVSSHGDGLCIAAVNSPASVTFSGDAAALEHIARELEQRQIFARFLQVEYAFHSAQMDPIRERLIDALHGIQAKPAQLPFFSTVTGQALAGPELGPEYWWHNVRHMVHFADGVCHVFDLGCDVFVELSPHPVLGSAVLECGTQRARTGSSKVTVLPSLRRHEDERATMLRSLGALYAAGQAIDWAAVLPGPRPFIDVPLYPWQRERYWFEPEETRRSRLLAPVHPLLGRSQGGPQPAWEVRLDLSLSPYLADHRVQGASILPGTAYLEMAFAVARQSFGAVPCQIEDLKLTNPCFLAADQPLWLQTSHDVSTGILRVHSRPPEGEHPWTEHCHAVLRSCPADHHEDDDRTEGDTGTPSLIQDRQRWCSRVFSREECYDAFRRLGLDYGPRFQLIERGWQGDRESVGLIVLPETDVAEDEHVFHPALLDACFQVVILAERDFKSPTNGLYLPVEIERARLYRRPGKRLWSHARLREKNARWSLANVDVYDEQGRLVAQVQGLRSRHVPGSSDQGSLDKLLYAYQWQRQEISAAPVASANGHPGKWLIFADSLGFADRLAERLRKHGDTCTLAWPGTGFTERGRDRCEINPACPEDMVRLLTAIGPVHGVVHLWNVDFSCGEDLQSAGPEEAYPGGLLSVLHLVQAWERVYANRTAHLFLVTRGAQAVSLIGEAPAVLQAPLIGLGHVIVSEYPRLRCKLVDLDPASMDIRPLLDELSAADDEDEIAFREAGRHVARYRPLEAPGECGRTGGDGPYRLASVDPGSLAALHFRAFRRQLPGPSKVEIEVKAAGLNFSDVMKALGIYPGLADGPLSLGAECSGMITAIGDGVDRWEVGDEVVAVASFAFGSHVVADAELCAAKPDGLSFAEAATCPIAFVTASYALTHLAQLAAGERVLIHSAAGGVGLAAVQIARRAGAEIFATAGTPEKRDYLKSLGIEHVMDSRSLAFADEVLERTGGRGVDVILNSLAGEAIARGLDVLADYGRFLEIGKRDIYDNSRLGLRPFRKNLSFFAIDLDRVMRERPVRLGSLLAEVMNDVRAGRLTPLPFQVLPISDAAAAFRTMQQGKHIGKIVLSMESAAGDIEAEPLSLEDDGTYLITGGLGGFGMEVARWLVEKGARHLVLVGRRAEPSVEARQTIVDLERQGVRVAVLSADVAREEDLASVLAAIDSSLPPLRGVIHAAMVLEDSLLVNGDAAWMRRALAPKVQGAWNLHRQTRERRLDFFVLFSSLSSVFGHAGQGNYAAANAFLDTLAHFRRAQGLPALTVNWGYVGDAGYLAGRQQLGERLERQGVKSFTAREGLALLEKALRWQLVQVSVMRMDWSRWRGLGVTDRVSPRFAHLCQGATDGPEKACSRLDALLREPVEERRGALARLLGDKVRAILGVPADRHVGEKSLLNLGFDSLMAVELRNWIESELHVNVAIVELMRSPGLSNLCDLLLTRLPDVSRPRDQVVEVDRGAADQIFPLTHGQRGLWFLSQVDRTSPAFNISYPVRIRSPLDVSALRRALQIVIDRHASLRTTFTEQDGELRQHVHENLPVPLEVIDVSAWEERRLRDHLEQEVHRPFDLERGPLVRMYLFSRAPEDHVFLLTAHHLVGDFWSLVVVLEEMRTLYPALRDGAVPDLPRATGHYRDFVAWQTGMLAGPEGERLWTFWQRQLADVPAVLDVATVRPRPAHFTYRGRASHVQLEPDLIRRLRELGTVEGATLYSVLLATFQVLVHRYSGQEQFVIGSPFAGRSRPEFEDVVGYFVNMVPLRADVSGDITFRHLLRRVSSTVLDALHHQDYPFSLLVERLNLPRDAARTPLVQVAFTLERAHRQQQAGAGRFFMPRGEPQNIGGLALEPFYVEQRTCQCDLEMVLYEDGGTVEGMLHYNSDLFDAAAIGRLLEHFQTLLAAVAAAPDRPVRQFSCLDEKERRRVLYEWNETRADYPRDVCLHGLFERQAARTPAAIALTDGEATLSYGDLDAWANRLARHLRTFGVGRGSLVALCLERSPEMIAAILGVLKAGAAYVPLDPDSPADRLHVLVKDTGATVLLTQQHLRERLTHLPVTLVCVDACEDSADVAGSMPSSDVQADDLAYVLYTSGSTGKPKGVMIEHRAICNTIQWRLDTLPVHDRDGVLLTMPYVFDPSIGVIFQTLAAGGRLVLPAPGEERDPSRLLRYLAEGVTILQALPTVLRVLLDRPEIQSCRGLRWICCGGEVLSPDLPARLFALLDTRLFNLYGPTEAALDATWWECRPGDTRPYVPIGRPIANAHAYVLDDDGQPAPVDVPGELYLGGAGLARGYLNDAELTAVRFLPDPFRAGGRMYRTGDRARWLEDGTLEFLGRLDLQVKLRGYRIELGEIEATLANHPAVCEAAVRVEDQPSDRARLIAYVVSDAHPEQLRRYLREQLPAYMLPAAIAYLPTLPRTAGGKVDRTALCQVDGYQTRNGHHRVPPRNRFEEFLAQVLQEMLCLARVGVDDNFFELGGNSLQAAVFVNRLQRELDAEISLAAFFEAPTIAGLARQVCQAHPETISRRFGSACLQFAHEHLNGSTIHRSQACSDLLVPLQRHGPGPPLFLIHPPGGIVICYQTLARHLGPDQPVYGIRCRGLDGESDLPRSLEDMAQEYLAAIRTVQSDGPYRLGGWSLGGMVALEMAQQLLQQQERVDLLALLDTTIPAGDSDQREAASGQEYGLDLTLDELAQLGPDEQLPYLWDHVQRLGLVEPETPLELVEKMLHDMKKLFHLHVRLASEYTVRAYPGRITLFRPSEAPVPISCTVDRGWSRWAAHVDVHFVPGLHHTMVKEPHVQELALALHACLQSADMGTVQAAE